MLRGTCYRAVHDFSCSLLTFCQQDRWTVRSRTSSQPILPNELHLSILRFTVVLSFIFKLFVLDLVVSASDGEGFCMGATAREGDGADT